MRKKEVEEENVTCILTVEQLEKNLWISMKECEYILPRIEVPKDERAIKKIINEAYTKIQKDSDHKQHSSMDDKNKCFIHYFKDIPTESKWKDFDKKK